MLEGDVNLKIHSRNEPKFCSPMNMRSTILVKGDMQNTILIKGDMEIDFVEE